MVKLSQYVKVAEAARVLGVSQNTLLAWSEARKISMHRDPANGYRLFRRMDLEGFPEQTAQPVSPPRRHKAK